MRNLDAMREATGPYYRGRRVSDMTDDGLVREIEECRVRGMSKFVIDFANSSLSILDVEAMANDPRMCSCHEFGGAVAQLMALSPEGVWDAAARFIDREYRFLWNEALDRDICHRIPERPSCLGG